MEFNHFSHKHPLIKHEERSIEEEINRDHFCSICNLPILLSSFYICSNAGCKYLLHEACVINLPEIVNHPWFPTSPFRLLEKHPTDNSHCKRCRRSCESFSYVNTSDPKIIFHPTCAMPMWPIKSKHKSHPLHPLEAVGKKTSAVCDACAEEQDGYFFLCRECNFWIHVDCALLPRIIKCTKHVHYLFLTYSSSEIQHSQTQSYDSCLICSKNKFGSGLYSCAGVHWAHLSCAIKDMKCVGTEEDLQLIYLPIQEPSKIIQQVIEMKSDGKSGFDYKLHEHPLIPYNDTESCGSDSEAPCCNACMQPTYSQFYACGSQTSGCNFHLHQLCSALPSTIRSDSLQTDLQLHTRSRKSLCSLFYCIKCNLLGNGFSYYTENEEDDEWCLTFHVTCPFISLIVKHVSHKHHVLHPVKNKRDTIKKCCSENNIDFLYKCFDCNFIIDNRCASLPEKIKHEYDRHPLDLITTGISKLVDEYLCEFCEEEIDTRFWYYGCEECNNLFHVMCIPSVGSLSKVKFGNAIEVSCHTSHPVTFVRMLGFGSQSCGYCKEIVEGFVDEMAFHCSKCDFWMHFKCAEECSGAEGIPPLVGIYDVW